jgi:Fe-S oxidoreductase
MYHDPCHSPMKTHPPLKVVNTLINADLNGRVDRNDRCCGESGTLAVSRPDISTQVRFRKAEELKKGLAAIAARAPSEAGATSGPAAVRVAGSPSGPVPDGGPVRILTSCPSCLQGLSRYQDDTGIDADYIVVEIARHMLGEHWLPDYVARANNGGIERVLV